MKNGMVEFYEQIMQGPEWESEAACKGSDPDIFFPNQNTPSAERAAKQICRTCVVRDDCLEFAVENEESGGVWGGMNRKERKRVKSKPVFPIKVSIDPPEGRTK